MRVLILRLTCAALVLAMLAGTCGCGREATPTQAQIDVQNELGQAFLSQLSGAILPNKDNNEYLRSLGVMLSEGETVKDMSAFDAFLRAWEAGEDSVLTVSFRTKSEVYARYQLSGGVGYYFRCEVPKETGGDLSVVSKVFEDIELSYDEQLGKLQFKLIYDKQNIATFTFRPVPLEGDEQGAEEGEAS